MENPPPPAIDEAEDMTPQNRQGPHWNEPPLIDESPMSLYCTPGSSLLLSCTTARSMRGALEQNNSLIFNEGGTQAEKLVQHLSFSLYDSPQSEVVTGKDSVQTKKPTVPLETTVPVTTTTSHTQSFVVAKGIVTGEVSIETKEPAVPLQAKQEVTAPVSASTCHSQSFVAAKGATQPRTDHNPAGVATDRDSVEAKESTVPLETKQKAMVPVSSASHSQSFVVAKSATAPPTDYTPAPECPFPILNGTFDSSAMKEALCKDLQSTFIGSPETGDVVTSQKPLNETVDVGTDLLVDVACAEPVQHHHGQGDGCLVSTKTSREADHLEQDGCCAKDATFHKGRADSETAGERVNASPVESVPPDRNCVEDGAELLTVDKNNVRDSECDVQEHAKEPAQSLAVLSGTFEMDESIEGGLNTAVDIVESYETSDRTVSVKAKVITRKSPVTGSAVQSKQPSQPLAGTARKMPTRPSLMPRVPNLKAPHIRRSAVTTTGQGGLPERASQPLRATLDGKGGQGPQPTKAKVTSKDTAVKQLRPPLQFARTVASKQSQSTQPVGPPTHGLKKELASKQRLNETMVVKASERQTGVKTLAAPATYGAKGGRGLREPRSSTAAGAVPKQGCSSEPAQPQAQTSRLQRPKLAFRPSQARSQPPTQTKKNLASTPVRDDAVPAIGHPDLPTPIKKC